MLDSIGSFLINNKDTINTIANTVGTVSDSIGKVAGKQLILLKKARELKNQGLSNETAEKFLKETTSNQRRTSGQSEFSGVSAGSGFYFIKK